MRISKAKLKNEKELNFGDFNVFIGGNAVGKTTLLIEIYHQSTATPKNKYYWIESLEYKSNNLRGDLKLLKASLSRKYEGGNLFYYSQASKDLAGNIDLSDNIRFSPSDADNIESVNEDTLFTNHKYRRPFIAISNCESRLELPNEAGLTAHNLPAQDAINVLFRDSDLLSRIDRSIHERFNYHFDVLSHIGTKLEIGISKESIPKKLTGIERIQEKFEKIERWKEENFKPLTEAGHGIRSMIRLLTSLLEPVNQIILIDEPELHLYPSQKRWLGKQLVSLAEEQNKQIFLVTHDPMVLQGILDCEITVTIFRVDREEEKAGEVSVCELKGISDTGAIKNQDQYLQSLFYQRSIVVEGASDRAFYQNMIEELFEKISDKDLGFIAAGGKGNVKHIAEITSRVGLKVAYIFDLDVIFFKPQLINNICSIMGGEKEVLGKLTKLFNSVEDIKNAKSEAEKNRAIKRFCGYSDKKGLDAVWVKSNESVFKGIINKLESVGIFLVPQGTLESWAPEVEPKVRFAELAPEVVLAEAELKNNFQRFAKKILNFLDI